MKQVAPEKIFHLTQKHCILFILLLAAVLRLPYLFSEWQYDEIWTLLNFTDLNIGQILTDISLPNNHPVNTLLMKLLKNISEAPQVIRAGVFLAGLYVVFLTMKLAGRGSNGSTAAMCSAGILAGTAPGLILFSVTARGYIFQLAGLMLCADGLMDIAAGKKTRYTGVKIIAGGVLSFLSVSSGIMFLGVLALGFLLLAPGERRWDRAGVVYGVVLLIAALAYYLPLYDKLRAGQQWGNEIASFASLISFGFTTLKAHLPLFPALLALCGVIFLPRMRKVFLLALLPPVMALFTKAGPERVYLPLTAVFIIIGSCGAAEMWKRFAARRKVLVGIFICGVVLSFKFFPAVWAVPTPAADMKRVLAENDPGVLPVIASTSGFPVMVNEPEIAATIGSRAHFPERLLMLDCADGVFNGADVNNSEQQLKFPVSGTFHAGTVPGYMYRLVPVESFAPGETVLAFFPGRAPDEFLRMPGDKLRLNLWFNQREALYICNFSAAEIPYFAGGRYFRIGGKNE